MKKPASVRLRANKLSVSLVALSDHAVILMIPKSFFGRFSRGYRITENHERAEIYVPTVIPDLGYPPSRVVPVHARASALIVRPELVVDRVLPLCDASQVHDAIIKSVAIDVVDLIRGFAVIMHPDNPVNFVLLAVYRDSPVSGLTYAYNWLPRTGP